MLPDRDSAGLFAQGSRAIRLPGPCLTFHDRAMMWSRLRFRACTDRHSGCPTTQKEAFCLLCRFRASGRLKFN